MFDVGFSEIVLIAVVALVVIGPERLPKAARTMGLLFGRLQRYVTDVKADINREIELDELRRLQKQVQGAAQEFRTSVESAAQDVQAGARSVEADLNAAASEVPPQDVAKPAGETVALPGVTAPDSVAGEPPRQPALPGFDRI
jgi:sec-independent protein translocase protein TatB